MSYRVRYGFSTDQKILERDFLKKFKAYHDENTFIKDDVCFADFMNARLGRPNTVESPVYYTLLCNETMLKELIEWINSLSSGVTVKFIKSTGELQLVNARYSIDNYVRKPEYKNFTFGHEDQELITKKKMQAHGVKVSLPISNCTVMITIDEASIEEKALLEYLTLVVIRGLDNNEMFLSHFHEFNKKEPVIERILEASNGQNMGHSIYCGYNETGDGNYCISSKNLAKAMNLENIKYACKNGVGNGLGFNHYRQTPIIDFVFRSLKRKERNK